MAMCAQCGTTPKPRPSPSAVEGYMGDSSGRRSKRSQYTKSSHAQFPFSTQYPFPLKGNPQPHFSITHLNFSPNELTSFSSQYPPLAGKRDVHLSPSYLPLLWWGDHSCPNAPLLHLNLPLSVDYLPFYRSLPPPNYLHAHHQLLNFCLFFPLPQAPTHLQLQNPPTLRLPLLSLMGASNSPTPLLLSFLQTQRTSVPFYSLTIILSYTVCRNYLPFSTRKTSLKHVYRNQT